MSITSVTSKSNSIFQSLRDNNDIKHLKRQNSNYRIKFKKLMFVLSIIKSKCNVNN